MKIVHLNLKKPVKKIERTIVNMFTREVLTLKAIHRQMTDGQGIEPQFPGFIA